MAWPPPDERLDPPAELLTPARRLRAVLIGAGKGLALAALNVVVVATVLGLREGQAQVTVLVAVIGAVPAGAVGLLLGALGAILAARGPWLRRAVLLAPAVALVWALARVFGMTGHAQVAAVPTLIGVLLLERWTRARPPPPPIPPARATM